MDEVTLELFDYLVQSPELDEEGMERSCAWMTALLRLRYLTDREKENALEVLDFLALMEGAGPLMPLVRVARAKLRLKRPLAWDMEFPANYRVSVDGEELDVEDLRRRGIPYVDFRLVRPIRSTLEYVITRRLHSDGRVEVLPEYQVFQSPPIGGRHMFNVYGEKAVSE